jgi:hypothetical protein
MTTESSTISDNFVRARSPLFDGTSILSPYHLIASSIGAPLPKFTFPFPIRAPRCNHESDTFTILLYITPRLCLTSEYQQESGTRVTKRRSETRAIEAVFWPLT